MHTQRERWLYYPNLMVPPDDPVRIDLAQITGRIMRSLLISLTVILCTAIVVLGWRDWEHQQQRRQWQSEQATLRLRVELLEQEQSQLRQRMETLEAHSVPGLLDHASQSLQQQWLDFLERLREAADNSNTSTPGSQKQPHGGQP